MLVQLPVHRHVHVQCGRYIDYRMVTFCQHCSSSKPFDEQTLRCERTSSLERLMEAAGPSWITTPARCTRKVAPDFKEPSLTRQPATTPPAPSLHGKNTIPLNENLQRCNSPDFEIQTHGWQICGVLHNNLECGGLWLHCEWLRVVDWHICGR